MQKPLVSVGMPVFNGEKYLPGAIESILGQDFTDFELIVADNASTDDTARICEAYARQDHRVRYHRHETNIGAAPNHNYVFRTAQGRYFKWAAHDDECRSVFLSRCLEVLERNPQVVLAYSQAELMDQDGALTGHYTASIACPDRRPSARVSHMLDHIGFGTPMYGVVRRETLARTRLHGSFVSADLVLLAELAMLGEIRQIPEPLLRKRLHPGRSQEAHRTEAELLAWFDPRQRRGRHLPAGYQMTLEYVRAAWGIPLRTRDKLACTRAVIVRRHRGVRLRRWIRSLVGLRASHEAVP